MNANVLVANLHLKYANKKWGETFQLVRTCTDKPRDGSKPCEPLRGAVERLQEVLNVSSSSATRSRLETMARRQGMGFHVAEATCYLTADLFYLEVALLPGGGVEDVTLAPHAGPPVRSQRLLQLLRARNFSAFSAKLAELFVQYNIPGENEMKMKLFEALQHLSQDLQHLYQDLQHLFQDLQHLSQDPEHVSQDPERTSGIPGSGSEGRADPINDGPVGLLTAAGGDRPLALRFFSAPGGTPEDSFFQGAQVGVATSDATHELPLASSLRRPARLDAQGRPVFLPPGDVPRQALPACFVLRLQPPMALPLSLISKIGAVTGAVVPDVDQQGAPLHKLLMSGGARSGEGDEEGDAVFSVRPDAGAAQAYVLPADAWGAPRLRAALVDRVPFAHPAHVPALLPMLRHQSAINALLRSCVAAEAAAEPERPTSRLYELRPESEASFSVTFQRPSADSLAVLLVNVTDSRRISCELFGAGIPDPALAQSLSDLLKRSLSLPLTLRALHSRLEEAPQ